jgi:hypothetical protein
VWFYKGFSAFFMWYIDNWIGHQIKFWTNCRVFINISVCVGGIISSFLHCIFFGGISSFFSEDAWFIFVDAPFDSSSRTYQYSLMRFICRITTSTRAVSVHADKKTNSTQILLRHYQNEPIPSYRKRQGWSESFYIEEVYVWGCHWPTWSNGKM